MWEKLWYLRPYLPWQQQAFTSILTVRKESTKSLHILNLDHGRKLCSDLRSHRSFLNQVKILKPLDTLLKLLEIWYTLNKIWFEWYDSYVTHFLTVSSILCICEALLIGSCIILQQGESFTVWLFNVLPHGLIFLVVYVELDKHPSLFKAWNIITLEIHLPCTGICSFKLRWLKVSDGLRFVEGKRSTSVKFSMYHISLDCTGLLCYNLLYHTTTNMLWQK